MFGEEKDQTKECKWKMFFSFAISKYLAMQTQITFFFTNPLKIVMLSLTINLIQVKVSFPLKKLNVS